MCDHTQLNRLIIIYWYITVPSNHTTKGTLEKKMFDKNLNASKPPEQSKDCLKKNMNTSKPSEHPPDQGGNCPNV